MVESRSGSFVQIGLDEGIVIAVQGPRPVGKPTLLRSEAHALGDTVVATGGVPAVDCDGLTGHERCIR
jgi:hypothetical protein